MKLPAASFQSFKKGRSEDQIIPNPQVFFSILLCIRLKKEMLHIFSRIINISPKKYLQNICSGSSNDQNPRENVVFGLKGISSKRMLLFFIAFFRISSTSQPTCSTFSFRWDVFKRHLTLCRSSQHKGSSRPSIGQEK